MVLAYLLDKTIYFYSLLILARIILSWFRVNHYNHWYRLLCRLTDPFLDLFRPLVPSLGGIDFSPIIAFLVLNILRRVVFALLAGGLY
ncbi:MAG: YggT family protein [Gemmatimonadota bacterium]|nr:YggT family protein [Gemmatimonadota bacterium]